MTSESRGRRERPAKPALSREWIVAETIKIARAEGLEKATMRRVAQALDTGPASLYVYVANTAELHAAVLDELTGTVKAGRGGWRTRLERLLAGYGKVLFTYPGLARSALVLRPMGPNTIRLYDQLLGLLLEGGVASDRAAWGIDLLLLCVTASAAEHSEPADGGAAAGDRAKMDAATRAVRAADPAIAPHIASHVDAVLAGTPLERNRWAIRALVNGIAATDTAARP